MTRLLWVKRKSVAAVVICAVLAAASIAYWQMNQRAQAAILNPHAGLVGWWRFDEGSGTIANDSSGFGNDGTIYGATWVDGKYNKALSFNGVDNYVTLGTPGYGINGELTLMVWIKPTTVGMVQYVIGAIWGTNYGFSLYVTATNNIRVDTGDGSGYEAFLSDAVVTANTWYFVAYTKKNGEQKIWINANVKSGMPIKGIVDPTAPTHFGDGGGISPANTSPFNGTIDEVQIYNRALSADEIQDNFQGGPNISSNLLAKIPKGTTQVIATLSWQGPGNINVTIRSPSENYTEASVPMYQKTVYSTSDGTYGMLNIKRLSVSVVALSSDQNWYFVLDLNNVVDYKITVEVQK